MKALEIPVIEGDRIRLEPLSRAHSGGMFELWSQPEVCEFAGPAEDSFGRAIELPAASTSQSDRLLDFWVDRAAAGTGLRWAVVLRGTERFVGALGFNALGTCCEYAYHFVPSAWGMGLATESSALALDWCYGTGAERVEAWIEPANSGSIRLALRLGFESSGESEAGLLRYCLTRTRGSRSGGG